MSQHSRAHKLQLLSPRATTTEACALQETSPQWDARALQLEKPPVTAEKVCVQQRPTAAKNKKKFKKED